MGRLSFATLQAASAILIASVSTPVQAVAPEASAADRPVPPPPPPSDAVLGADFKPHLVLDTGRAKLEPPDPDALKIQIHGEYQARLSAHSDVPLRQFRGDASTRSLGQTTRLVHWLRITPQLTLREDLKVVGQIDVPRGFIAGQPTRHVDAAETDYAERQPVEAHPRWLYLEYLSPVGLLRVGQQPSHWGMGIVANDGDHPTLFGDYERGAIVERILFATRPFGKESPFNVAIAGDLVFRDSNAKLSDDELAFQGVLAAFYADKNDNMLGFYGVYRAQSRESQGLPGRNFDETLNVFVLDSTGKFNAKIPGTSGHVFGEYEVAYMHGDTNYVRTTQQTRTNTREDVRALGSAVRVGAVTTSGRGDDRYGDFVATLEWGWASGDADPNDGVSRRFRFDPNHNVGLILFNETLRWKTARASSIAQDPELVQRPNPGADLLPSEGGVFGATYLNPTIVVRPVRELDLKLGAVIAQTTADFVDPVRVGTHGVFENYDGGDPRSHDLGIELDAGFEYRLGLDYGMTLQLGAQGGVLFPGNALADAGGHAMGNQYIAVGRLGLQY